MNARANFEVTDSCGNVFADLALSSPTIRELLATVDHLLRQLDLRDGQLAPDQIEMLRQSAARARLALDFGDC